ncbi:hypothetical protein NKH45_09415, partial [Mesorhizobium sp. M1156]|uniref:hypothetical protein n=1 Tax=Mesorhizobium sp. M1156 TaxID=2957064 RepID=UPI0033382C55
ITHNKRRLEAAVLPQSKKQEGGAGPAALVWNSSSAVRAVHRFTNAEPLYLFVLTQFPRESATRFSRENRFTLFLELL